RNPRSTGRGRKDPRNSDGTGHEIPRGGGAILHRGGAALGQGDPPSQYSTAVALDRKSRDGCIRDRPAVSMEGPKDGDVRLTRTGGLVPLRSSTHLPVKAAWRGLGVPHTVAKDNPVWGRRIWTDEAPAQLLQAAGDRRAGAAARTPREARAHDPFRAAAHREAACQGAGADRGGRRGAREPRGRDSG